MAMMPHRTTQTGAPWPLKAPSLLTIIRSWFAWREVRRCNQWRYMENGETGERIVKRIPRPRGWMAAPPDEGWLDGSDFGEDRGGPPPPRPSR
jgi:hypothetical protein